MPYDRLIGFNRESAVGTRLGPVVFQEIVDIVDFRLIGTVDGLVAVALANDETIIEAAEAAVTADIAGRDLIESGDPRLLTYIDDTDTTQFATLDASGRVSLAVRMNGNTDIALPNLGENMRVREMESPLGYDDGTLRSASGIPAETATINGCIPDKILARWAERGGYVTNDGGAVRQFTAVEAIIAMGQSNSAVSDVAPPTGMYRVHPRLFKWDETTHAIVPMPSTEAYLLPSTARARIQDVPDDVAILIIPAGAGETGFRSTSLAVIPAGYEAAPNGTWDRTLTADPLNRYKMAVDMTRAALLAAKDLADTVTLRAALWSQGENDTNMINGATYAAYLDDMIAQFRTDLGLPSLEFIIGSMVPEYIDITGNEFADEIADALVDTPRRVLKTAYVHGPRGMVRSDQAAQIHWATVGQVERGRMFAAAFERSAWNFTAAKAIPPQNLRLIRSGTSLVAEYDPPTTRHISFEIDKSENGGAWVAMTKVGAIALQATSTVAASGAVRVRARAVSDATTSPYVYASA